MSFPDEISAAEKAALKRLLIRLKRFWNSTTDEDGNADKLINAFIDFGKKTEENR